MTTNTKPTLNSLPVLHYAWLLYKKGFVPLFLIALGASAANQLLTLPISTQLMTIDDPSKLNLTPLSIGLVILAGIIMLWCYSILQSLLYGYHCQANNTFLQAVLVTFKQLPLIVINGFIFALMFMLGLMLYVIPGILIATLFMLYLPLMLFEKQSGLRAFTTSFQWVKPFFLQVVPIATVIFILLMIPSVWPTLTQYIFTGTSLTMERAIDVILMGLLLPLVNAIVASLYIALKMYQQRKVA